MGGGELKLPAIFFPTTSTNVGISPQNFLTFSCNPLATLVWNFKAIPSDSPNFIELEPRLSCQKSGFSGQTCKTEVMISSLKKVLALLNFGHTASFTIWFESCDKILLVPSSLPKRKEDPYNIPDGGSHGNSQGIGAEYGTPWRTYWKIIIVWQCRF